jgi:Fic family protein
MQWNWQQADWPSFRYSPSLLQDVEARFLKGTGVVIGALHHVDQEARQGLTLDLISEEMIESSAIEGEILDRASVRSSLARHLGLTADKRRVGNAEAGAAELMADLFQRYALPLNDEILFGWHAMLMNGRRDIVDVGCYRTHDDAMQIVSGPLHAPRVHFEAPPSSQVAGEMAAFIAWFNDSAPDGTRPLGPVLRAGIAHLWFESIHPFEDGNGRIGRAIAEKALAQALNAPTLTALAKTIHRHRKDYYAALHRGSRDLDIDDWLNWFGAIVIEAQERTLLEVRFLIGKTRLFDGIQGQINERQEKALLRMLAEGPDGFVGGLSARNYQTITDAAPATATRDLAKLVELGAFYRTGEHRHARYHLKLLDSGI